VQVLELAWRQRRMAPDGLGGASGQGARDVHPVLGFQEDDLGSSVSRAIASAGISLV
jgi:hypothetical protein